MIVLTKRERLLALGLAAAISVSSLYALVIRPTYHRIQTLERIIPEKQTELHTLEAKSVEYTALCKGFEDFRAKAAAQDPNFQLAPYLEGLLEKHGLTKNIVTMAAPDALQLQSDYSETVVKIELDGIPLKQLLGFLKEIEASDVCAQFGSVHISKNRTDDALVDSTIEIRGSRPSRDSVALGIAGRR
jgi:type II secretory pathway component PulM